MVKIEPPGAKTSRLPYVRLQSTLASSFVSSLTSLSLPRNTADLGSLECSLSDSLRSGFT